MELTIAACQAFRYELPLTEPLQIGEQHLLTRSGLLIRLQDQVGHYGYGETAPLPGLHREDLTVALRQFKQLQAAWLDAKRSLPPADWPAAQLRWLAAQSICPALRHGLELAVFDLLACQQSKTLAAWLSPKPHRSIAVNGLLPRTGDIRLLAQQLTEQGYTAIKIKVGQGRVEEDIARVQAVRDVFGNKVDLRVDANRAWDLQTAMYFGKAVADCRLDYVEEPLRDSTQLAALHQATGLPLALDETLVDAPPTASTIPTGVAAFVLKPSLLGGITRTMAVITLAEQHGIKPIISSVFESGLGLAYLANCAAALIAADVPMGLDTYRWLREDLLVNKFSAPGARIAVEDVYFQARDLRFEHLTRVA